MPQISILMSTYNSEKFIDETIKSVINQTFEDWEFVIVDDASKDNTCALIEKYCLIEKRIKFFKLQKNLGQSEALNFGICKCSADYIARIDGDDVMYPDRLSKQIEYILKNDDVAVVSSLVHYIDKESNIIGKGHSFLTDRDVVRKYIARDELLGFHHPAVLMKKDIVQKLGGYRKQFWPADDLDLWNRIVENGYLVYVLPEYLLKYRIHSSSVSIADSRSARVKVRWLKECMLRRRRGMPELTWNEFQQFERHKPFVSRMNQSRKDLAKILYKHGVSAYSNKEYLTSFANFIGSGFFQPSHLINQISAKSLKSERFNENKNS